MEYLYVKLSIGLGSDYISRFEYVQLTIFGPIVLPNVHSHTPQGITNNGAHNVMYSTSTN